jgi:hypothetical protein
MSLNVTRFDTTLCGNTEPYHVYWECESCRAARSVLWARRAEKQKWQRLAHQKVTAAKKNGVLPALNGAIRCVDCGNPATEYDHRDYARPLDVQPVCHGCNTRRGSAQWPVRDTPAKTKAA